MISALSVGLLAAYLLIVKVIATRSCRLSARSSEDYFLAGRNVSGPALWATILATIINSLAFTAVPGLILKGGVLFLQMWVVVFSVPLLMRVFGPAVAAYAREHNIVSQGELFGMFFRSSAVARSTGIIALFAVLPFMTIQLSAIAKVVAISSGGLVPYSAALLLFGFSTGLYLFLGGARAVIGTDIFQGICVLALLLVSAVLFYFWTGGFEIAFKRLTLSAPELFTFGPHNTAAFLDHLLSWPLAFFLWPQVFQRLFMAKSTEEIKRSSVATLVLFAFIMLLLMTIGLMSAATFIGSGVDPDTLVAAMYQKYLPIGSVALVLGVTASAMSTLDSGLLALSATICRDFSKRVESAERSILVARRSSLLLLLLVMGLAWSDIGRGAMTPLVTLGASAAALFIWPLLGMVYLPRIGAAGVLLSYGSGALAIALALGSDLIPYGPGTAGFFGGGSGFLLSVVRGGVARKKRKLLVGDAALPQEEDTQRVARIGQR